MDSYVCDVLYVMIYLLFVSLLIDTISIVLPEFLKLSIVSYVYSPMPSSSPDAFTVILDVSKILPAGSKS